MTIMIRLWLLVIMSFCLSSAAPLKEATEVDLVAGDTANVDIGDGDNVDVDGLHIHAIRDARLYVYGGDVHISGSASIQSGDHSPINIASVISNYYGESFDTQVRGNGEEKCEGHGYDETVCTAIGCCHFDGQCWSSVGQEPCETTVRDDEEEVCEGHGYDETTCAAIGCCHFGGGQCWSSVGQEPCGTSGNGEEVCEGHGYDETTCTAIRCCHFDDGQCSSSVGQEPCWTSGPGEPDWTCDFCTKASLSLISHSTSTTSLESEISLLIFACPNYLNLNFCRKYLPTFWAKFGKLIWSGFWAHICADKDCPSKHGLPEFWHQTVSSPPSCQSCSDRINAHLEHLDKPFAVNKLLAGLPKFCDAQEDVDVEECNEFGEWRIPEATTLFKYERSQLQNIDWIIEICQWELNCNKDD